MLKNTAMKKLFFLVFSALILSASCANRPDGAPQNSADGDTGAALTARLRNEKDELIARRLEKITAALKLSPPVLLLETTDEDQKTAQDLAVKDPRFVSETKNAQTGEPLFSEVFGIYPLRPSDLIQPTAQCASSRCLRVEMYNFALNQTRNAIVDIDRKQSVAVTVVPQSQPDIPPHLTELAAHIAGNSEEVKTALGGARVEPLMTNTKTALNKTKCERSKHLCVAPTYVAGEKALWAIVDLTDLALVGVRWTQVGSTGPAVTEKSLQNEVLTKKYCETSNALERGGWKLNYMLTSSDGLKITDVEFQGKPVLSSAKLVDWHVSYSNSEGFGYSDAVGCPYFSQAAVVAAVEPRVAEMPDGFSLIQKYYSDGYPTPCNYSYEQRFDFYNDGRFRVVAGSLGRGCGDDGTYRPVTRIAFAGNNNFAEYTGADWKNWPLEAWQSQKTETLYTNENYQYRIAGADGKGFYMQANRGQFGDKGRGDNAFVYVTKNASDRDEGESDLVTIGPCCNTDYRQGPEKFIEPSPEPIENSPLVLWYVAQLKNDGEKGKEYCWAESIVENGVYKVVEHPCYSGAMFVPVK